MKKILLIHDLFSSSMDVYVHDLLAQLCEEQVIVPELPIHPQEAMAILRNICEKEQPDVIVGWQSGAALAQQFFDYDRILVSPNYQVSYTLETLLNGEDEVHIPYLFDRLDGQKYISINDALIAEFEQMEQHQFDGVRDSSKMAFGCFWFGKNEENCRIHAKYYSDVTYSPGEDFFDMKAIKGICAIIKGF